MRSTSSALSSLVSSNVTLVSTIEDVREPLLKEYDKSLTVEASELLFRPIIASDGKDSRNTCYYYDVYRVVDVSDAKACALLMAKIKEAARSSQ
ncbi:unnamed protein product [Litomosoides sigmodontis]|uniref:Uncharacterized protein n=1 Tax=Litomosoides sigmodontis TaxID=42156 RepID=A0A3P6UGZ1_LITSI|nr:unnamed protein product [Litomosoides sigmodontis]